MNHFPPLTRRGFVSAALITALAGSAGAAEPGTRLVILGSMGGPTVGAPRYQTSHVLLHKGSAYVVDCGYGVTEQLARAGVKLADIRDIFITHHHPDHNIELGTLIYFAWFGGLETPLGLYGPPPLGRMARDYLAAQKPDVDIWIKDLGHKPMPAVVSHEIARAGPVMHDANVRVSAAVVEHPPVTPALAYRFDFPDRSIVFSGDTAPVEAVVRLAKGADILVHEAMYLPGLQGLTAGARAGSAIAADQGRLMEHLLKSHSPVEEVGRIAQEAGVKTLVLSHLVPIAGISDETWRTAAATHFKGEIIVARDLMVI